MPTAPVFLLVDDVDDNRFLLTKTLHRKFPGAQVEECSESEVALALARRTDLAAAIVHRAADMDGISLIEEMRKTNPNLSILSVSGYDRREQAFKVGATGFLHYDAWLSVGTVIEDMMRVGRTQNPFAAIAAAPPRPQA